MPSVEERFWGKVEKTETCWLWSAGLYDKSVKYPYGAFTFDGKKTRAHIVSYLLHAGAIPTGMVVRHTCDVSLCVRPDHLILGTQAENVQDMLERGRNRNQNMDKVQCDNGHSLADAYVTKRTDRPNGSGYRRRCRVCSNA